MKQFKDKIAVITGAASGIGEAIAHRCAQEAMRLVLVDQHDEGLHAVQHSIQAKGVEVISHVCDVSQEKNIIALVQVVKQQLGAPQLLFNNAGIVGAVGALWEMSCSDLEHIIQVNFLSVAYACHHFIPLMIESEQPGHIINTASGAGLHTSANMTGYMTSKHSVVALSEILQRDLRERGIPIDVSILCPGMVDTSFIQSMSIGRQAAEHVQQVADYFKKAIRLGLSAEEVAKMTFEGIRQRQLYILTHYDEQKELITERFNYILKRS